MKPSMKMVNKEVLEVVNLNLAKMKQNYTFRVMF